MHITALLPWQYVTVRGPSMVPGLRDGDAVVVRHGAAIRAGDVVLARFATMPDRLVIKRAVRRDGDGWWLASDNALAGGDSASHGVADVLALVTLRIRRGAAPWRVSVRRVRTLPPPADVADSTVRANPE
ncbi:S24 family peptidase [uncultured Jatrophihabitans sp.]|uniref:S24 family peptidase n=1 Tax=uncultured Jatrophihabitans sp. TaxID=1610747 RepID=UPI0035CAF88E